MIQLIWAIHIGQFTSFPEIFFTFGLSFLCCQSSSWPNPSSVADMTQHMYITMTIGGTNHIGKPTKSFSIKDRDKLSSLAVCSSKYR